MGGRKEARRICQQRRVGPSCAGEDGDLLSHAFYDLINLFVVFNPTGIVPSYLYFTQHVPHKDRRTLAIRCVLIATVILVAFIVIGQLLLEALGIGLPAFKIAGGVVLLIISVKMILEDVDATAADDTEVDAESPITTGIIASGSSPCSPWPPHSSPVQGVSWSSCCSRTTTSTTSQSKW
jgi:threonine/homoserine/homoserine lactone efflux protein